MDRLKSLPIRVHLMILILLSVLPAIGIILFFGLKQERSLEKNREAEIFQQLKTLQEKEKGVAASARQLLSVLARLPEIERRDSHASNLVLHEIQGLNPEYSMLIAVDPQGKVFAASIEYRRLDVSYRKYFQDVMRTKKFSVGEYAVALVIGKPVLHFAVPSLDASGKVQVVLVAGYDLNSLAKLFSDLKIMSKSTLTILDHNGIILYSTFHPDRIGTPEDPHLYEEMLKNSPGQFFAPKGKHMSGWLSMYTPVSLEKGQPPYMYIRLSLEKSQLLEPVRRLWIRNILILTGTMGLALVVAWGLGSFTLAKKVMRLAEVARAMGEGDLSVKTGLGDEGGEVGELARAFDAMGGALAFREAERDKALQALRDSENRYRIASEQTGQAIYDWNISTGQISWAGALEQITGFSIEEFQQVNITEWEQRIHPEDRGLAMRMLKHSAEDGGRYEVEYRFRRKDGSYCYVEDTGTFLRDGNGLTYRMLGAMKDISERKRADEEIHILNRDLERRVQERTAQLKAANRELEAFSYSVSHDLKAPLRSLDGFSQILLEDYGECLGKQGEDYLARIRAASQRMNQLIEDMLSLSRITRKEMLLTDVDLIPLAKDIINEFSIEQPERKITFITPESMTVRGDKALLEIALRNLLGNAWKFTRSRTEAIIELGHMEQEGRRAYFVKDNGAGFNMEYVGKLFNAFQRLHRSDEFEGTGIGLAIVKRIILRHGGEVWAEGEPDKGATFYFTV